MDALSELWRKLVFFFRSEFSLTTPAGHEIEPWDRACERTSNTCSTRQVLGSGFHDNFDNRKRTGTDPRALSPWQWRDNEGR